ncbi:hypothetical protein DFH07DRAFT_783037 [Mycena maculata]|uniref:Uncharacterized protein n=1 Tax=Mycena maculata TaxID=230809 RepID=A0AAD7HQN6_9AGAR|nr:hypothetical protein DFH07DRAFT_783037 [Mycena maculata]
MYVVDMADGFKDINDMRTLRIPCSERFKRAFKVPYVSSTYDNQRQWWERAGKFPALTADAIKAGHTQAGLWSLFRQNVAALEKAEQPSSPDQPSKITAELGHDLVISLFQIPKRTRSRSVLVRSSSEVLEIQPAGLEDPSGFDPGSLRIRNKGFGFSRGKYKG